MRFDTETFYLKSDTDSGIEGLILKNRQHHHQGTSGIGLLHDLFEHTYKPIANPYLDEIAALGAFNEYRLYKQQGNIFTELRGVINDLYEAYLDNRINLKWSVSHVTDLSLEIETLLENYTNEDYYDYLVKYKHTINYYFNLGAKTFNNRFDKYFNSYWDLYYELGEVVTNKLNPLINSNLEDIKLTINYKLKEVKVEY